MSEQEILKSWFRATLTETPEAKAFKDNEARQRNVERCLEFSLKGRNGAAFRGSTLWESLQIASADYAALQAERDRLKELQEDALRLLNEAFTDQNTSRIDLVRRAAHVRECVADLRTERDRLQAEIGVLKMGLQPADNQELRERVKKLEENVRKWVGEVMEYREYAPCWYSNENGDCGNWTTCYGDCPLRQLMNLGGYVPQEDGGIDKQSALTPEPAEQVRPPTAEGQAEKKET